MESLTREEKKIVQARVALLLDQPFFGHIAMQLEPVADPNMFPPTMGTDGYHLSYHPDFVNKLSFEHLIAVLGHEVYHLVLFHITRRQNREPLRWNFAADFAVNDLLKKDDNFELPDWVLYNPKFSDKTAEWIYNQIPETQKLEVTLLLDNHEGWGKAKGKGKKDEKAGDSSIDITEGLEQRIRELTAQAATAARMKGKFPAHLQELVDGVLQPKLDWKTILQDMIVSCAKSDFCLFPPNKKHLYRGFILPGITGTEINIACVIDTSGSISNQEMKEFLSEVKGICDAYDEYTIYLFTCDAEIHQRWELHQFDPVPTLLQGRGGTDFRQPLKEAESLPITTLIYLTDGYGTYPDKAPYFPVIWVTTTDYNYPWGQVIRLPERNRNGD